MHFGICSTGVYNSLRLKRFTTINGRHFFAKLSRPPNPHSSSLLGIHQSGCPSLLLFERQDYYTAASGGYLRRLMHFETLSRLLVDYNAELGYDIYLSLSLLQCLSISYSLKKLKMLLSKLKHYTYSQFTHSLLLVKKPLITPWYSSNSD